MSQQNGLLIASSSTGSLLFKASTGALLYGVAITEYEAIVGRATSTGGSIATHWMEDGRYDANDARDWIEAHASSSTVRWGTLPGGTTINGISWFFWGRSRQQVDGVWYNGADGCYGIYAHRCRLTVGTPIEVTRVQISANFHYHNAIPIDVAFYFSDATSQPLSPNDILGLQTYRANPGNSIDVHLQVPAGATVVWVYVFAHDWAMGNPTTTYIDTSAKGQTNASVYKLWYTASTSPTPSSLPSPELDWTFYDGPVEKTVELKGDGPYKIKARGDAYRSASSTTERDPNEKSYELSPTIRYHYPVEAIEGTRLKALEKTSIGDSPVRAWWLYSKEVPELVKDEDGWVYYVFKDRPAVATVGYDSKNYSSMTVPMPTESYEEMLMRKAGIGK